MIGHFSKTKILDYIKGKRQKSASEKLSGIKQFFRYKKVSIWIINTAYSGPGLLMLSESMLICLITDDFSPLIVLYPI